MGTGPYFWTQIILRSKIVARYGSMRYPRVKYPMPLMEGMLRLHLTDVLWLSYRRITWRSTVWWTAHYFTRSVLILWRLTAWICNLLPMDRRFRFMRTG